MNSITKFKIGDSVKVKANVMDPDFNINIEGWQGRILEINEQDSIVGIKWDSLTLENMPGSTIDQSEVEGLDWRVMFLYFSEIEITKPRDTEGDVQKKISELEKKYIYSYLGEQGQRIQKVLKNLNPDNTSKNMEAWASHFEKNLQFPFEARVSDAQDFGPLHVDDKVKVEEMSGIADLYGVIVKIRKGRNFYHIPLCDLDVCNEKSSNYLPVDDYSVWFSNR